MPFPETGAGGVGALADLPADLDGAGKDPTSSTEHNPMPYALRRARLTARVSAMRLSGSNRRFDLVEDPKTEVPASQYYSLPDDERAFERSEVINHHFLNGSELAPRQRRHGVLLAVSLDPIPEQFAHHSRVEGTIVIVDQLGREFSAPITWLVERSQRTAAQEKRAAARKQQYWVAKNTGSIFERAPGYPPAVEERKSVVPGGGVAGEDARDAHERPRANIGSK